MTASKYGRLCGLYEEFLASASAISSRSFVYLMRVSAGRIYECINLHFRSLGELPAYSAKVRSRAVGAGK